MCGNHGPHFRPVLQGLLAVGYEEGPRILHMRDFMTAAKGRVYVACLLIAATSVAVTLMLDPSGLRDDPFLSVAVPAIGAFCLLLTLVLVLIPRSIHHAELAAAVSFCVYAAAHVYNGFFVAVPDSVFSNQAASFAPWIPCLFVLFFIMLQRRAAVRLSLMLYVVIGGLVLARVFFVEPSPTGSQTNVLMQQYLLGNATILVFLWLMGSFHMKAALADTEKKMLSRLANTDPLTGLWNRRQLSSACGAALTRATLEKNPSSLIVMDIDHFKTVNDAHGHERGDAVLQSIADLLQTESRDSDIVARYGGEEFAILLPACDLTTAREVAERLRVRIEALDFSEGIRLTSSFGVAESHKNDTYDTIFRRADRALYEAKQQGRNAVCCSGPPLAPVAA